MVVGDHWATYIYIINVGRRVYEERERKERKEEKHRKRKKEVS